jgi:hypothetical protein
VIGAHIFILPISHFPNTKKRAKPIIKRKKRNKKKEKRGEKEDFSRSHFLFLSSLKFEMEEEKRGKMEEITSNFKAMKKKKTLLRLSTKQGLKLCGFIFGKR